MCSINHIFRNKLRNSAVWIGVALNFTGQIRIRKTNPDSRIKLNIHPRTIPPKIQIETPKLIRLHINPANIEHTLNRLHPGSNSLKNINPTIQTL